MCTKAIPFNIKANYFIIGLLLVSASLHVSMNYATCFPWVTLSIKLLEFKRLVIARHVECDNSFGVRLGV